MDDFYLKLLRLFETLLDLDPEPDSPTGVLLAQLAKVAPDWYAVAVRLAEKKEVEA